MIPFILAYLAYRRMRKKGVNKKIENTFPALKNIKKKKDSKIIAEIKHIFPALK